MRVVRHGRRRPATNSRRICQLVQMGQGLIGNEAGVLDLRAGVGAHLDTSILSSFWPGSKKFQFSETTQGSAR